MAVRQKRNRGCWWFLLGLAVVLLVGGLVFYWQLSSRVNLTPALGSGAEAALQLPPGFQVNVFAGGLNGPRFIAFGPDGALYVADRGNDRIVALVDADGDGTAETTRVFAEGLSQPHSLVYHEGAWYVGVPSGVVRLEDADGNGVADGGDTLVNDYPTTGFHTTRTVEFLPDGRMVVAIGSSCNVCQETDLRRAAVVVYDGPEATGERLFATGLRNAVGLAVHPQSGELWATNNGRDLMGDELPPETVYIVSEGADYGWPRCHSGDVVDPEFGGPGACDGVAQPVAEMQAHSAPLGLVFYTGQSFPADYHGDLFIAFHGSWNRSEPTGYKVVRLPLDGSQPAGPVEDFATGWLNPNSDEASGRPVGLAVGPDGALYISDDKGGFIYRIYYVGS
ncbi:MAG: PQQ-dependent sugar dehydrogenase [Chloroflexi bacterium]|nr:PQQ-dependent sugar dehydrogenase [Chloroflexota bacterium]MCI0575832.1 PQQ-dependent sugar dehydrogenase [Chloroflexota bacterium]MCI0646559.1 PQQ-dependent sugar dehydrogenase [Chloroflexota bacterium]MCI0726361.1 PQQ-dependent sugar dehydrogenase [Chloroflexota bacterium]